VKVAFVAAALFLLLGLLIVSGWTEPLDRAALHALRQPGHPGLAAVPNWLVEAARTLTEAGLVLVRGPIALVAALWLRARGQGRAAAALLLAVVGEELLVQIVKALVHRPRPAPAWALVVAHSSSFPSGHAAGCMALYPLLGWLAGHRPRRGAADPQGSPGAWAGAAAGVALALAVGLTRVLLGVHWLADVAAGWLLGGAIALFAAATAGARRVRG
jgi:undecaprenyl-diphosphatase